MTAPDPTAGEHHPDCYQSTGVPDGLPVGLCDCRVLQMIDVAASPPAVAASTATSEDVEALALVLHEAERYYDWPSDRARHVLASDWLAAREAAARAEERERIARKSERLRRENPMNGDGANHMLDQVQRLIDAPEVVADERRTIHAERAEAYERLEAENAARRAGEAGTR